MESLQRRSDGFAETASGLVAVKPLRQSGNNSEISWFEYKTRPMAETTVLRWRIEDQIAVIDEATAKFLLTAGYARNATDGEVLVWNQTVDAMTADALEPAKPDSAEDLTGAQEGAGGTTTPANTQTALTGQSGGSEQGAEGTGTVTGATGGLLEGGDENADVGNDEGDESSEGDADPDKPKGKKTKTKPATGALV